MSTTDSCLSREEIMSALSGILAELGIARPEMHPERDPERPAEWILDQPFRPEPGKCYEVAYGKVFVHGRFAHVVARIRADGPQPAQWFDIDEEHTLDAELQACPVRAFRPMPATS